MLKIRAQKMRYKGDSSEERSAVVERWREFLRLNYMARRGGGAFASKRKQLDPKLVTILLAPKLLLGALASSADEAMHG